MKESDEKRIAANMARILTMLCVRNTELENLHAGIVPTSKTGDFTDVTVIDAEGREIPWPEVSHFDDDAMRALIQQIVNRIYTFYLKSDDPQFRQKIDRWIGPSMRWDEPELDEGFMRGTKLTEKNGRV
ncbi:MAG TPA: hypothetical protein ENJ55_05100 [Rhizobiales bacterium]|nr:hypothetical protein [Hyphomicrobiales bacterium]